MRYFNALALISLLLLASCATKGQTGALGGGAAGAIIGQAIGHNTAATLIGAAAGTMLGYIVGNEMDKYDRQQLNHSYERGLSHHGSSWVNPDNGHQYTVTPDPAYQDPATHKVCRRAEIKAVINNKPEKTYATACRGDAGQWELRQ